MAHTNHKVPLHRFTQGERVDIIIYSNTNAVISLQLFQVRSNILRCIYGKFMVCTGHRLQHYTRHKFPMCAIQNVQKHLKSTIRLVAIKAVAVILDYCTVKC